MISKSFEILNIKKLVKSKSYMMYIYTLES